MCDQNDRMRRIIELHKKPALCGTFDCYSNFRKNLLLGSKVAIQWIKGSAVLH